MADLNISKLETLAGIRLSEEERKAFEREIGEILRFFSQIDELDTEAVEVTYHEHLGWQRLREDIPEQGLSKDEALMNAPDREDDYFKIPPIL